MKEKSTIEKKEYTWHKVVEESQQPKLGYEGDETLGYTPCIWVTDLHDINLEEPILDEMIPEFLEKYQKRVNKFLKRR